MNARPWSVEIAPDAARLAELARALDMPRALLDHALDPNERPRLRTSRDVTFVLLRVPVEGAPGRGAAPYRTAPIALFVTPRVGLVIASRGGVVASQLAEFVASGREAADRVLLRALELTADDFLARLEDLDARADAAETRLERSLENREVIELLRFQKSLVYFSAALEGMFLLFEEMRKSAGFHIAPEDEDWLAGVVVEFRQAIETCALQRDVLGEMMDAFASIISNNLNVVMKFLAAITVILTMPMIVASVYGMNVPLPGQHDPHALGVAMALSLALGLVVALYFRWRRWL